MKYLILGQGVAGSVLAWFCHKAQWDYHVVDDGYKTSSTKVAAGLFNPFTGPKMALSWNAERLFQLLQEVYSEMQVELGGAWYRPLPLYRPFLSIQEQNDILAKAGAHPEFLQETPIHASEYVHDEFSGLTANQSGYVNTVDFLHQVQVFLKEQNRYSCTHVAEEEVWDWAEKKFDQTFSADQLTVIDCRGYASTSSAWWQHLPWQPNKGEVLEVRWKGPSHFIANRKVYAVQLGNNHFKIGATYSNHFQKEQAFDITSAARKELTSLFGGLAKEPFEVIDQQAAVRPAIAGRRPVVGQHPSLPWLYILGALGSKGISLAPYCAKSMMEALDGSSVPAEIDVRRFSH